MTTPAQHIVEVAVHGLHLRVGPGTSWPILTTLPFGARVTLIGEASDGFIPVQSGDVSGWLAQSYTRPLPLLLVDAYRLSAPHPFWSGLVDDMRYIGAILKATQGWSDYPTDWFCAQWKVLRLAARERYGTTFFRGAYHYLVFAADHIQDQADFYLKTVERAGGFESGDLIPIVDIERGQEGDPNYTADAALVEDVTERFIDAIRKATKQSVLLYGRSLMRDLQISSPMGASYLWNPGYTEAMPSALAEGWPAEKVMLWQYTNGTINCTSLPAHAPGLGAVDASVFMGGDLRALAASLVRWSPK